MVSLQASAFRLCLDSHHMLNSNANSKLNHRMCMLPALHIEWAS